MDALVDRETNPLNPTVLSLAMLALAGVLAHTMQLEGLTNLAAATDSDPAARGAIVSQIITPTKDAHLDLSVFTGDTYSLRTEPPALRTREDDEKDYSLNNRQSIDDGYSKSKKSVDATT